MPTRMDSITSSTSTSSNPNAASAVNYSSTAAREDDEFSQGLILPPLVVQLKKILDQYSDDTQILKELIQNAEDAGATEVKFLYDKRTYGQDARYLHHSDLVNFQGPALLAYNDSHFTDDDWRGIRMLSQSVKQNDRLKVGHFGIGFKSVFHLTDLPSILSGDRLGFIDPHQYAFTASSHGWNISKRTDLLQTLPHQLEPFIGTFDCDRSTFRYGKYKGTMFRFPLRCRPSPLCSDPYSDEKMQNLLKMFETDAHLLLLFLRNVEQITVYQREKDSTNCRLVFRVSISSNCLNDIRQKRADFIRQIRSCEWQERPLVTTYPITIVTESFGEIPPVKRSYQFLVTNYYCGGTVSPIFRNLSRDAELGYLPWVGTAMKLDDNATSAAATGEEESKDGRLFCFLPLPVDSNSSTRLPVHIHGFFALEQNRKYVKWPGPSYAGYSETHMDKGLLWNQCLLREALPRAYIHLMLEAIRLHSIHVASVGLNVAKIYNAFPNPSRSERKFEPVVSTFYTELLKRPMVYFESPDGCEWLDPKTAVFNNLDSADDAMDVIVQVLTSCAAVKLVTVPQHVMSAVRKYAHFNMITVTPALVADAYREVQFAIGLRWEAKMKLLRYLLKQTKFELLDGLELLPLANGGFDAFHFNPKKAERPIYIVPTAELQQLLPGLKDDFLEMDIDDDIKTMLTKAAIRGYTQLRVLEASNVGQLIPKCLPSSWLTSNGAPVEWNPSIYGHPPSSWLEALWLFLVRYSPRDLSIVDGLPLLPYRTIRQSVVGSDEKKEEHAILELVPLSSNSVYLARTMDGVSLGEDVERVAKKIGITVIDDLPDYVKSHPVVSKLYVFAPTYLGVLRAVERRCVVDGRNAVVERIANGTTVAEKRALRELFAKISMYEMPRSCMELLTHLPLFETTNDGDNGKTTFASVAMFGVAAPAEKLPFRISRPLITTTTVDSQALAKLLGVRPLNMAQLLTQVIFPDIESAYYDNAEVQSIMLYVLRHYNYFNDVDRGLRKTLRSLPFLPKSDMLLTVDRFYDPDQEILQKLFLFEENFPSGDYADSSIVVVLREIGLRGVEDVEPEDLLESALTIQQMYKKIPIGGTGTGSSAETVDRLVRKSDALLEYLHRHKSRLKAPCSKTTLAVAMRDVKWVRGLSARPAFYPMSLPWRGTGEVFFKPSEMVIRQHLNLVGSIQPVVAAEVYAEVAQEFHWDDTPSLKSIIAHLANIISSYDPRDKVLYMEMCRAIYAELAKQEPSVVADALATLQVPDQWIWHGEGFTSTSRIVIIPPFMDLRPYFYSLPTEVSVFSEFLSNFGVRTACDLIEVLETIKLKYDAEEPHTLTNRRPSQVSTKKFNETEVKRDLHICVCILNELKSHITDESSLKALQKQLFVPVHCQSRDTLRMAPLLQCSYCDEEWIRHGYSTGDLTTSSSVDDSSVTLVHPNVPTSTAEALGIPSLMSKVLEGEELEYSFGQSDSLTNRLNTLLAEYSDGFAVPKELVQNADDAGATEIRFLYDERTNAESLSCLIDDGMKECHGPALWVYNNATFSDDDFENITKLNGATKELQTDKIGRFGLGFNAVYNLTDVPMFISRHCIVIFDPHTTFLGKSIRDKSKPGLKLDLRRHRRKLRSLDNQFKPFNDIFGCDLRPTSKQESYPATLFRLPLRTQSQAARSEICSKHYDDAEVKALLQLLVNNAENLLLFTQNVLKIRVFHLPSWSKSVASDMVEIFRVAKEPVRVVRELSPIAVHNNDVYHSLDKDTQYFIGQCSILRAATDTMKKARDGVPADRLKFPDHSLIMKLDSELLAAGQNLLSLPRRRVTQTWLVCGYMGQQESLKLALQEQYLLPTAGVAVKVDFVVTSGTYLPQTPATSCQSGAIFSYLPIPMRTGLPVHINGMFAVASNRKSLCELNEDDKNNSRAIWNETLFKDAVATAYIKLLVDLVALSSLTIKPTQFYSLWPRSSSVEFKLLSVLVTSFYQHVCGDGNKRQPMLFSDGRNFADFANTIFLDCGYKSDSLVDSALDVCRQCCVSNPSKVVVQLFDWLRAELQSAELDSCLSSRTYSITDFVAKILLPNIDTIHQEDRDSLLIDALLRKDDRLVEIIKQFHCIPVTPDGTRLRQPTKLIDPVSPLAQLYLPVDARFPYNDRTYARPDVLVVLREIGMKQSGQDLAWADVIERAHMIASIKDSKLAVKLSSIFLATLANKLNDNSTFVGLRQIQQQLLDIAFIPAMPRSPYFPLAWKAAAESESVMHKPNEMYAADCQDLVGCIFLIADISVFPKNNASELLGFLRLGMEWKEPTISQVVEQLDILTSSSTEHYFHDDRVMDEVQRMCFSICSYLQSKISNNIELCTIKELLASRHFILGYNRFLSPKQIAFDCKQNYAPHLYSVPDTYRRHYSDLLRAIGVREKFDVKDYISALHSIHESYGENPLGKEDLQLSLQLVTLLNECITESGSTMSDVVKKFGTIYVPDSRNCLASATDLCYNEPDCNWVPAVGSSPSQVTVKTSHPMIPYTISKQLGVNTQRQEVLKKHSRGIPFGQRESLTNRIKRILSGYPCDKEILKELLQNADDSGATEIHFVKDPRQHGTERVFEQSWRPLQGPALCVYNNRPFTEADLEGIQQLGQGSKSLDPNKTGQYGVGFNCVYHLTDAPSFLTKGKEVGETLCVFDPHAKFVPGATVEEPGRRYDNLAQLRNIFTDVFPCYLEDCFDLENGTMFRFPLRNEELAKDSDLSDQTITLETVDQLLTKFRQEIFDCLLFVQHVTAISFSEINTSTRKLSNVYSVNVSMSERDQTIRQEFFEHVKTVGREVQAGNMTITEIPLREAVYAVTLQDNNGCKERWLISQRIGVEKSCKVAKGVVDAVRCKDLALLPRGGVAAMLDVDEKNDRKRPSKAFCFLPLPLRIDLPVHINGHFALDHEARRNLWQDDDYGTKTEWNMMLFRDVIAPAYVTLLRSMRTNVSSSTVVNQNTTNSSTEEIPGLESYIGLFPPLNKQTNPGYWKTLAESVYRRIHEAQEILLPVIKSHNDGSNTSLSIDTPASSQTEIEWVSTRGSGPTKPYFDNLAETFSKQAEDRQSLSTPTRRRRSRSAVKKPHFEVLRQVLLSGGLRLVRLPLHIFDSFVLSNVDVQCISPHAVIDHFCLYKTGQLSQYIPTLPADISSTLFCNSATLKVVHDYCSQDVAYFRSNLVGLPLLLCEDGQLRQFSSRERTFLSVHNELLPGLSSNFIHHSYVGPIFKDVDIDSCMVFKRFDVAAFASLLPQVLPAEQFRWKPGQSAANWNKQNSEGHIPSDRWLHQVWSFLCEEFDRLLSAQTSTSIDEVVLAKTLLEPLKDWCLIPAYTSKPTKSSRQSYSSTRLSLGSTSDDDSVNCYLVPLVLADTVLDYSQSSIINQMIRQCFGKIGIAELDVMLLDGSPTKRMLGQANGMMSGSSGFVRLFVSSLEQPTAVLKALRFVLVDCRSSIKLTPEECFTILKYFAESVELWNSDNDAVRTIRSLPIHMSLHGSLVSIGPGKAFLLEDEMPSAGMENWQKRISIILLRPCAPLSKFYEILDCPLIATSDVYLNYVFPNFDYLSTEDELSHLHYIRDFKLQQLRGSEKTHFIDGLANLHFLPLPDGSLHAAMEFCDPYHPVFKIMLEGRATAFPPAPFDEFGWREFLKLAGLKTELTADVTVNFARQIADQAQAHGESDLLFRQSRTLVTHMFKMPDLPTSGILERIAGVAFIPSAKINSLMTKIHAAYSQNQDGAYVDSFVKFCDGVPEEHEVLVWTSAHLLPDWANPYKLTEHDVTINYAKESPLSVLENYRREIGTMLKVPEHPPLMAVVEHVQNICKVVIGKSEEAQELRGYMKMDVMTRVYKFLQSRLTDGVGGLSRQEMQDAIQKLAETPCIVSDLGQTFVRPKQVVISLYDDDQIYPYLNQMPTELGEFKRLFLHLGATMSATAEQYALVLESMFHQTGGEKLHPNELRLAFKAVNGLFSNLKKHKHSDVLNRVQKLYLPTKIGNLFRSTEIVFIDNVAFTDRIQNLRKPFLVDLHECWLTAENHEETVKLLPQRLRPQMLTAVVKEVLEERCRESVVLHSVADKLKYQLSSKAFAQGLIRLIKNEHRRSGHRVRQTVLDSIEQHLRKIHVYGIDKVVTYLCCDDEQRLAGSESDCQCFIDTKIDEDSGIETWNIYINKATILNEELLVSVAEVICHITGDLLRNSIHYIQPILSCPPHSISKVLDRLKVRSDISLGDLQQPTLPVPGSFIPIEDHHLLMEEFEEFEMGEYVGFELDDDELGMPTIIYAVILERIEEEEFYHVHKLDSDEPAVLTTHRKLSQRYQINIGEDRQPTLALATDLYKFHRVDGFISRGGSQSDTLGRRMSIGSTSQKSPKQNYRESFYRSSVFEQEDPRTPASAKTWERSGNDSVLSPSENGQFFNDGDFRQIPTKSPTAAKTNGSFRNDFTDFLSHNENADFDVKQQQQDFDGEREIYSQQRQDFDGGIMHPQLPAYYGPEQDGDVGDFQPAFDAGTGPSEEEILNTERVMTEVSDTLEEAWKLPENQRKKIIKRLLLKWHPDKNIGNEMFATVIMQHIQSEIERLELGLPRPTNFDSSKFNFDPRNPFTSSASFQKNFASAYQYFFEQMNQRAKEHREQRERYQENFSREYGKGGEFGVPPTFASSNPQPAQAKRFLRQAQEDLRAADNDYDAPEPAFEWACFKAHQAAEKALKAAQFAVDAVTSFSHDLVTLAASLEDVELRRLAQKLQKIVGNSNKLYNPDPIDFVVIPHEEYTREMACDAVMCAVDVLERVKEFVELRDNS